MRMDTLLELSGSENESATSSRQKLRKALGAVTEAGAAHGQPFSYAIKGDLVHVKRRGSIPQRRHLAKKAKVTRKSLG